MLVIDGVSKRFDKHLAVDNLSVSIPKGQFVGVIGRSGAGKSTLLRMINRLADPSAGEIRWDGRVVSRLQGAALRDWHRRCAMIFQQFNLVGRLDVLTYVLMGRLVFDGAPAALTTDVTHELYGMEAHEVMDHAEMPNVAGAVVATA